MTATPPLLAIHQLAVRYGKIPALSGLELQLAAGEMVCLLGANGAGKSSTLKAVAGLLRPQSGEIRYRNEVINALRPDQRLRCGIALVPEGRGIFQALSVAENLRLGSYCRTDRQTVKEEFDAILDRLPRLRERLKQRAGTLSGGEQQMLALARALLASPQLLLLDEPSLGLAPVIQDVVYAALAELHASGISMLLVEQNAFRALQLCDRAYVLEHGVIARSGPAAALLKDDTIKQSYLGS